ncbi:unnamed protein product [Protopolystoma xenopodis]|uniref:Uncharacterized protein n=1 Tax=Protopolystoma xenopodis TaxID=117903 RepID=A0A448WS77_9PLAT|nr:unnamed protein product [Protopolystoma xenopodis]
MILSLALSPEDSILLISSCGSGNLVKTVVLFFSIVQMFHFNAICRSFRANLPEGKHIKRFSSVWSNPQPGLDETF